MATFIAILNALAALPALAGYLEKFVNAIILWQIQRANNATLAAISDAAALSARATTAEERFVAAEAWQRALSRPRVSR